MSKEKSFAFLLLRLPPSYKFCFSHLQSNTFHPQMEGTFEPLFGQRPQIHIL